MVSCQGDDFRNLYHLEPMHTQCAWVSFLIAAPGNGRSPKNCGFQSKTDHQQPNRRCETKRAAAKKKISFAAKQPAMTRQMMSGKVGD